MYRISYMARKPSASLVDRFTAVVLIFFFSTLLIRKSITSKRKVQRDRKTHSVLHPDSLICNKAETHKRTRAKLMMEHQYQVLAKGILPADCRGAGDVSFASQVLCSLFFIRKPFSLMLLRVSLTTTCGTAYCLHTFSPCPLHLPV